MQKSVHPRSAEYMSSLSVAIYHSFIHECSNCSTLSDKACQHMARAAQVQSSYVALPVGCKGQQVGLAGDTTGDTSEETN